MTAPIETLVFDLDNTLYSPESGLLSTVSGRISNYISDRLGLNQTDADILRERYRSKYGITLTGLIHQHNIDPIDFDTFVYDINYTDKVKSDQHLKTLLNELPHEKIVYTNAGSRHAHTVLNRLGLADCFDNVIAIEDLNFQAKPTTSSFDSFIQLTSINPKSSLFFEDSSENLDTAKSFGFTTAMVGQSDYTADYNLPDIYALPQLKLA